MSENTEQFVMPPVLESRQRVVLLHTKGPYKGLHQIMGRAVDMGGPAGGPPPTVTDKFTITPGTRTGVAGLVKSTTRYLLYKEIDTPLTKGFEREQR